MILLSTTSPSWLRRGSRGDSTARAGRWPDGAGDLRDVTNRADPGNARGDRERDDDGARPPAVFARPSPFVRNSRFSARYHHASPDFLSFLERVKRDPAAFRGDITVAILGDSFVAGDSIEPSKRFTTLMQRDYDAAAGPRVKVISFGFTSYTTLLYDRLYRMSS